MNTILKVLFHSFCSNPAIDTLDQRMLNLLSISSPTSGLLKMRKGKPAVPLYDYDCLTCGNIFEVKQSFKDDPVAFCPKCNGRSRRKFHAVPVIYKGTGFYTTDYARSKVRTNEGATPPPSKEADSTSSSDKPASTSNNTDNAKNDATSKKPEKPDSKKQD